MIPAKRPPIIRVLSNAKKDMIGILFIKLRKLYITGIWPTTNPRLFNSPLTRGDKAPKTPIKTRTTVRFTFIKKTIKRIIAQRRFTDGIRARISAKDTPKEI